MASPAVGGGPPLPVDQQPGPPRTGNPPPGRMRAASALSGPPTNISNGGPDPETRDKLMHVLGSDVSGRNTNLSWLAY
jgi:hypothetical protein